MRLAGVVLATMLALALQTALARYFRGAGGVDPVLIVVIYAALAFGPVTGLLTGTFAGLLQDAMSSGIIGIGGLAKTVVGFVVGVVGTQFIVTHPLPRLVVFFLASALHALLFIGIYELLGLREFPEPLSLLAVRLLGNAVIGLIVFEVVELLPGAVERRRNAAQRIRR